MGMASVNVNIRMDAELKKEFEAFCSNVGMNMTTAFTIFARRTVRENRIPFGGKRDVPQWLRRAKGCKENVIKGLLHVQQPLFIYK